MDLAELGVQRSVMRMIKGLGKLYCKERLKRLDCCSREETTKRGCNRSLYNSDWSREQRSRMAVFLS